MKVEKTGIVEDYLGMSFFNRIKAAVGDEENITLVNSTPLVAMHILALSVFFVKFSWIPVGICIALYWIRVFALTGGYHRYFSHRTYKTSRVFQFMMAWVGATAAQCGPLWWASHHRHHHLHSDTEQDVHSPKMRGLFWSHIGWLMCKKYNEIDWKKIQDFSKFPELRFIDRFHVLPPIVLAVVLYVVGEFMGVWWKQCSGVQFLAWGFFLSTVLVYHATFCINSLTHILGSRRFRTSDTSRNNFFTALITMGEGWHNNHHRYPKSTRQGFYWWEIDCTYYLLKVLSWFRLVWDLHPVHPSLYKEAKRLKAKAKAKVEG